MSENWSKTNEAEIKTVIEQIKSMQSPVAIHDCEVVTFEAGEQEVSLTAWDAMVALCLVLEIPIEYA